MASSEKFLYFGYGSNLLRERIHIQNPTAVFKSTARLNGYKLDFDHYGTRWCGAAATVTECRDGHLWGVVWEIDRDQQQHLDNQEGVHVNIYKPIEVEVEAPSGERLTCRCYSLLVRDALDKRPSPQYMKVIIEGAKESGLPADYVAKLEAIEHNGYTGDIGINVSVNKSA